MKFTLFNSKLIVVRDLKEEMVSKKKVKNWKNW
jgi:hypothetical protein